MTKRAFDDGEERVSKKTHTVDVDDDEPVLATLEPGLLFNPRPLRKSDLQNAQGGFIIGRSKKNGKASWILPSAYAHISNRHCLIYLDVNDEHPERQDIYIKNISTAAIIHILPDGGDLKKDEIRMLKHHDTIIFPMHQGKEFNFTFSRPKQSSASGSDFEKQFLLDKELGRGQFAVVKKAIKKATEEEFAVKIFDSKGFNRNVSRRKTLDNEVNILMAVDHPCAIKMHEIFEDSSHFYLVLELSRGGELFDFIYSRYYPGKPTEQISLSPESYGETQDAPGILESEARLIFAQCLDVLKCIHEQKIVHRDLKPENILFDDKDHLHIKISDFGLSKILDEKTFLKTVCGSKNYVAPEVIHAVKRDEGKYGAGVDIWSLGVVLYVLLIAVPPSQEGAMLREQLRKANFDYTHGWWARRSDEAVQLVKRMLDPNYQTRATYAELIEHPWMFMKLDEPIDLPEPKDYLAEVHRAHKAGEKPQFDKLWKDAEAKSGDSEDTEKKTHPSVLSPPLTQDFVPSSQTLDASTPMDYREASSFALSTNGSDKVVPSSFRVPSNMSVQEASPPLRQDESSEALMHYMDPNASFLNHVIYEKDKMRSQSDMYSTLSEYDIAEVKTKHVNHED
ncbi:hypothetical protein BZG36_00823 [Bifiguratus adelaidae]|uniref:Protein kinase domain-containing protein n=1 Tax=Bifiguratus adelaidae TaxID=1938954 RepID=A0A261Y6W7_9FUNG|nr:hypothetical protein BZG36_00823 [Bifiguratus adelaidae]